MTIPYGDAESGEDFAENNRIASLIGVSPGMWMNLQLDYEFMRADREKGDTIRREVQPCAA